MNIPAAHTYHAFAVGEIACAAISDGTAHFSPAAFFANAPPDALNAALIWHGLPAVPLLSWAAPLSWLTVRSHAGFSAGPPHLPHDLIDYAYVSASKRALSSSPIVTSLHMLPSVDRPGAGIPTGADRRSAP